LIGAWLLKSYDSNVTGYYVLFGVSSLGRFAALALLFGINLRSVPVLRIGFRILGIRPASATVDVPILNTLDERAAVEPGLDGLKTVAA